MKKQFAVSVIGGLGLNIAFSSFITEYSDEADFSVITGYYDVFEANEKVKQVYKPNEVRDFTFDARDNNAEIINIRLYDMSDFIYKKLDYTQAWCKLLGLRYRKKSVKSILNPIPKYPYIEKQVQDVLNKLEQYEDFIIVQFTGGQSPLVQVPVEDREVDGKIQKVQAWDKVPYDYENEPLKRHYPTEKAQKFVELYHEKHPNTAIIAYQLPNEPKVQNDCVFSFVLPYLAYYELAKNEKCTGVVAIDSSLQHLVAGITKSVVLFAHTLPTHFGYEYNHNIIQKCRRDDILYFTALGPSGAKVTYIEPDALVKEVDEYLWGAQDVENSESV